MGNALRNIVQYDLLHKISTKSPQNNWVKEAIAKINQNQPKIKE